MKSIRQRDTVGLSCLLALIVMSSLSARSTAEDQAQSSKKYTAGDVFLDGSRVYIRVGKTGLGHEHAVEGQLKSGALHLNEGSGELVFDMTTFVADTATARNYIGLTGTTDAGTQRKVNANMRGGDVLNVGRILGYPLLHGGSLGVCPREESSDPVEDDDLSPQRKAA